MTVQRSIRPDFLLVPGPESCVPGADALSAPRAFSLNMWDINQCRGGVYQSVSSSCSHFRPLRPLQFPFSNAASRSCARPPPHPPLRLHAAEKKTTASGLKTTLFRTFNRFRVMFQVSAGHYGALKLSMVKN